MQVGLKFNEKVNLHLKEELEKNIFNDNLFENKLFENEYYFDFSECMKSCIIDKYNFVNYFKDKRELFKCVKRYYYQFKNNSFDGIDGVLSDFEIKNVYTAEKMKLVKQIIYENTGKKPRIMPRINRLCHKTNHELQFFYYEIEKNKVYRIVAIDLFHLIIPANDSERPRYKNDGEQKYKENKDNSICLSEILN